MLPLRYDNGVFVAPVSIGGRVVWCVVDTGSELLLVADESCGKCSQKHGFYSSSLASTGFPEDNIRNVIRFGTQEDTIEAWTDRVGFPQISEDGSVLPVDPLSAREMDFALVKRRTGESSYNIMGLLHTTRRSGDTRLEPFLAELMERWEDEGESDAGADFAVSMYLHPTDGIMSFGDPRPLRERLGMRGGVVYADLEESDALPFPFYIVRLTRVLVGDTPLPRPPTYLLFDSGSNYGAVGEGVMRSMKELGVACGGNGKPIVLEFESRATPDAQSTRTASLTLDPDVYCWKSSESLLIEPHSAFASVDTSESVFIMGSFFLHTFLLEFYPRLRRLGIQRV